VRARARGASSRRSAADAPRVRELPRRAARLSARRFGLARFLVRDRSRRMPGRRHGAGEDRAGARGGARAPAQGARADAGRAGTPVENHLGELFSIFAFLNPGLVQGSRKLKDLMRGPKDDVEAARLVARAVRPFLLRRTKEQVLTELPPKTEQIVACEMEGAEK